MRIVFLGTPEFAVPTMLEIVKSRYDLVAVYTRAPARAGRRGLEVKKTPVHLAADSFGIPVYTPTTLHGAETQEVFSSLAADAAVVAAYGLLLPVVILEAPRLGCMNLHASLLPRWRGAAPIQRAIMAGDPQTGVDVMCMDAGLDTGPIALRQIVPIGREDTTGTLMSRLAAIAAKLSVSALRSIESGRLEFRAQSTTGVCYAHKIEKIEADIDWTQSAQGVINQIHGLSPAPGAYSKILIEDRLETIKFLRVEVTAGTGSPGTLLSDEMSVACGTGALRVLQGQRAGKTAMRGRELSRSAKLTPGMVFMRSRTPPAAARAGA